MDKRQSAAIAAMLFFFLSVFPVRPVKAVPLVGLAIAAFGPGGTLISSNILSAGVSALIGGTIVALGITPSTADAPMRVPLVSDKPTIDAAMPPPAAEPVLPSGGMVEQWCVDGGGCFASQQAACSVIASSMSAADASTWGALARVFTASGGIISCSGGGYPNYCGGPTPCTVSVSTVEAECASGYSKSGGQCVLTNPRAAVSDGYADIKRGPDGFSVDPDEKDPLPGYVKVEGNVVMVSGTDSSGRPVKVEVLVGADGSQTYIRHYTQTETPSGSVVNTSTATVNSATGQVQGVQTTAAAGSITNTGTGAQVNTGADVPPIVFPDDYARTGEAGRAADKIVEKLDDLATVPDVQNPDIPEVPSSDLKTAFLGPDNKLTGLLGWTAPSHVSQCPIADLEVDWLFEWRGRFDQHCVVAEQIRSEAAVIFDAVWILLAFFIVLGA